MRGRRKSTYRNDWWEAVSHGGHVIWPVVLETAYRPYLTVFDAPTVKNVGLQRSQLETVKRPGEVGLLSSLRLSISAAKFDPPRLSDPFPNEPVHPGEEPIDVPEPKVDDFPPTPGPTGFFENVKDVLSGRSAQRTANAKARFDRELRDWKAERRTRERAQQTYLDRQAKYEKEMPEFREKKGALEKELRLAQQRYDSHAVEFKSAQEADLARLDQLLAEASKNSADGMQAIAALIVEALTTQTKIAFASEVECFFEPSDGILLFTVEVMNVETVGMVVPLKTKERPASARELKAAQEFIVHALSLRLCYEVFNTPEMTGVEMIGINSRLNYTDRHNGKRRNEIIGSLAVTRDEFSSIDIREVDAKLCFRSLKGLTTPSFDEVTAIRPVLNFDTHDKRIVEARSVVDGLQQHTNLAAMDWGDFEHVVRELFAKMFSSRNESAEVHVTRASRDYGVDALIHDPDPIHGGKFVIQAKRYVNTVDVAAVRDLFGTVQNEGANRGYLVTTSSFGPDAHSFAKGKPITLIDGNHLLQLLKDHGYVFRIDLREAREVLHGR